MCVYIYVRANFSLTHVVGTELMQSKRRFLLHIFTVKSSSTDRNIAINKKKIIIAHWEMG